ncbi:MAG: hypothetical protein K6F39_05450 [Lachnospiraceae bacterium]|nr:hypothetical protein [Lachnospiraceae bacterium]
MAISPIILNGSITASQDLSALKAHDDAKAAVMHNTTQDKIEHQQEQKLNRVRKQDDVELHQKGYDAREKGSNEYAGDGGKNRKKQNSKDAVHIKEKGGFDVSV